MKTGILAVAAFAALLLSSCSLTLWDYSGITTKKYALVYGVSVYDSAYPAGSGPNLQYPDSDARSVAAMLAAQGYTVVTRYVDRSGNEFLSDASGLQPKGPLSADPTGLNGPSKVNIVNDLQTYFQNVVGPNDLFLFYFSGHGTQLPGASAPTEYFVPVGGVVAGSDTVDYSLCVSNNEFGGMLGRIATKRKVIILDTCNSGGFIGNSLEADSIPQASAGMSGILSPRTLIQALSNYLNFQPADSGLSPYGGAMVLSAAGRDEFSYESPSPSGPPGPLLYHGVMTYYLLRAPSYGDLNGDGHVTAAEAFSLVKAGIESEWNAQMPGATFEPRISGGPIDFVLW